MHMQTPIIFNFLNWLWVIGAEMSKLLQPPPVFPTGLLRLKSGDKMSYK